MLQGAISMTIYYLYVKTHNITGLKYLGQTTAKNPYKYSGSGVYWKSHLAKYGSDFTTEIIKECTNKEDLRYWGKYYSDLWNIVESNYWANLKEEVGDGGRQSEEVRKVIGEKGKGRIPWNKGKHIWSSEERKLIGDRNKARGPQSKQTIEKRVAKLLGKKRTEEQRIKISKSQKGKTLTENHKLSLKGKRPNITAHNKDKNSYMFIHVTGIIEICTRTDLIEKYSLCGSNLSNLINGVRKTHKGWRVAH